MQLCWPEKGNTKQKWNESVEYLFLSSIEQWGKVVRTVKFLLGLYVPKADLQC